MAEEWREVPGYEGFYEVSNTGRVRSLDRITHQIRNGKVLPRKRKGKMLSLVVYSTGYENVRLCGADRVQTTLGVHRVVAQSFIPNPDNKRFVNHIDGNPRNNRLDNLEWTTPLENTRHAISIGLVNNKGISNPAAKYPEHKIAFAKALAGLRLWSDRLVGEYLGMPREVVKDARSGRNWRSVPATLLKIAG